MQLFTTISSLFLLGVAVTVVVGNVKIFDPLDKTISIDEGEELFQLRCTHSHNESVEWSQSGMKIADIIRRDGKDRSGFEISAENDDVSILTIRSINVTKAGVYKCANANLERAIFGGPNETDTVTVNVRRVSADMKIDGNEIVGYGDAFILTCTAHVSYGSLEWDFKGNRLDNGVKGVTIMEAFDADRPVTTSTLTRQSEDLTADDDGEYRCHENVNHLTASKIVKIIRTTKDDGMKLKCYIFTLIVAFLTAVIGKSISSRV